MHKNTGCLIYSITKDNLMGAMVRSMMLEICQRVLPGNGMVPGSGRLLLSRCRHVTSVYIQWGWKVTTMARFTGFSCQNGVDSIVRYLDPSLFIKMPCDRLKYAIAQDELGTPLPVSTVFLDYFALPGLGQSMPGITNDRVQEKAPPNQK